MKIAGSRLFTWMSVWLLSFFVKGDLLANPQEKPTSQVTDGASKTKHKVPHFKTQVRKAGGEQDKTSPLSKTGPSDPRNPAPADQYGPARSKSTIPSAAQSEIVDKTSGKTIIQKSAADGTSKDAAKMTSKHRLHKGSK